MTKQKNVIIVKNALNSTLWAFAQCVHSPSISTSDVLINDLYRYDLSRPEFAETYRVRFYRRSTSKKLWMRVQHLNTSVWNTMLQYLEWTCEYDSFIAFTVGTLGTTRLIDVFDLYLQQHGEVQVKAINRLTL